LWINIWSYIELSVLNIVSLCMCSTELNTLNTVLEPWLRNIFGLKTEWVAGRWTKLHSEVLYGLYWWVNIGGEWTERQWDTWDERNVLKKLKINTKFQLETLSGRCTLGDLALDEMLKTRWWTGHKWLELILPSVQLNPTSSCAIETC